MSGKRYFALAAVFGGLMLALAIAQPHAALGQARGEEPTPAFHTAPPGGPLPATMSPSEFNDPLIQNAYALAGRIKKILYQQPCYCHCDRGEGHGSLLDCYVSKHASICEICVREGFYSYEQSRKGKTAAQIREGIERGEWRQVDLTKYEAALPAK
jgi:hypothetical protein